MGVNPAFLPIKAGACFGGIRKRLYNALYNRRKKDVHGLTRFPFHQKAIKGAVTRRFSRQGKNTPSDRLYTFESRKAKLPIMFCSPAEKRGGFSQMFSPVYYWYRSVKQGGPFAGVPPSRLSSTTASPALSGSTPSP
jgi:hypothetical protein